MLFFFSLLEEFIYISWWCEHAFFNHLHRFLDRVVLSFVSHTYLYKMFECGECALELKFTHFTMCAEAFQTHFHPDSMLKMLWVLGNFQWNSPNVIDSQDIPKQTSISNLCSKRISRNVWKTQILSNWSRLIAKIVGRFHLTENLFPQFAIQLHITP